MWWYPLKKMFRSQKIELFVRHCHYSKVSQHKRRFSGFEREECHRNLMATLDAQRVNVTFVLDTFYPSKEEHFIRKEFPVIEIAEGTESGSFLKLLSILEQKRFAPETIVYLLEDDYLHRPGWVDILIEGFSLRGIDYVTLYDHKDKYFLSSYRDLRSQVFHTQSCHWRTTPSTTNTFAARYQTLMEDLDIHKAYSLGRTISADHEKFCALAEKGKILISSLPGWATHAEPDYASPCYAWDACFKK